MSSWIGDWERNLIPRVNGIKAKARTNCKIGRHLILEGVPVVWLRGPGLPLGLSCLECARPVAPDAVMAEEARTARPVAARPAPRQRVHRKTLEELPHGEAATYINYRCRCEPCRDANARRSAAYRARKRDRDAAGVTA